MFTRLLQHLRPDQIGRGSAPKETTAPQQATDPQNSIEAIERLTELRDAGSLTDAEFAELKSQVFRQGSG